MLHSCPGVAEPVAGPEGVGALSAATAPFRLRGIEARMLHTPADAFPMWLVDTSRSRAERLEGLLCARERERAGRYKTEALRHRYTVAHGSLRIILRDLYGVPIDEQEFSENEFGKPSLRCVPQLHFSISYSAGYALIGVSKEGEIGVDIEAVRSIPDADDLAKLHYTQSERAEIQVNRPSEIELSRRFLGIWVKKEACVKASGRGLDIPLDQLECGGADQVRLVQLPDRRTYSTGTIKLGGDPIVGWARNLI